MFNRARKLMCAQKPLIFRSNFVRGFPFLSRQSKAKVKLSNVRFFSNPPQYKSFFDSLHCFDPKLTFVKNEEYEEVYIERIFEPLKNCNSVKADLLNLLDNIVEKALGNIRFGVDYIEKQLKITHQLILIRDKVTHQVTYYLRHDVYRHLPNSPSALAMYRVANVPSKKLLINKITQKVMLEELEARLTDKDQNPNMLLVLRTHNPKAYQVRLSLSNNIYPDIFKFKEQVDYYVKNMMENLLKIGDIELYDRLINENIVFCNNKEFRFNLRSMAFLKNEEYLSNYFFKDMYNKIRLTYSKHIPDKYRSILIRIIEDSYNKELPHDYELLIARVDTKDFSKRTTIERTRNQVINDFFNGFIDGKSGDMAIMCTELTYKELRCQLNKTSEDLPRKNIKLTL